MPRRLHHAPIDAWLNAIRAVFFPYPKVRRLGAIAAWINANTAVLELRATTERGHCNTDWKPAGFRYIVRPGKGREGTRIKIFSTTSKATRGAAHFGAAEPGLLLDHNSAETYRHNFEVEKWLADRIAALPAAMRRKLEPVPPMPTDRARTKL